MSKKKSILEGLTFEDILLCIQVVEEFVRVSRRAERALSIMGGARARKMLTQGDFMQFLMQMALSEKMRERLAQIPELGEEIITEPKGDIKEVLNKIKSGKAKPIGES